jgi:hypothetical protein
MGRWRLSLLALGLAVFAVGLLAPDGVGQARLRPSARVAVRGGTSGLVRLGRAGGYGLVLYMPNDKVVIFYAIRLRASKENSFDLIYNVYAVHNRGNLAQGVVRAKFGSLGQVSLRFRPDGRVRRRAPGPDCEGGALITERGAFVGRASFHGENRYIEVSSSLGQGYVTHSPRLRCKKGQTQENGSRALRGYAVVPPVFADKDSIALVYASHRGHGRYVGITAAHPGGAPPGANVQLAIVESRRGMAIGRGAFLEGGEGTLRTSQPGEHPATATLAPPPAFYGRAAYSEESHAWTGNLGVRIAGSRMSLTGPAYRVHLCVANPIRDKDGCEFFKAEPPPDERSARPGTVLR